MSARQCVLVTGAGQSVGRAMAEAFLARGDAVWICDNDPALLEAVLAANPGLGGSLCDVAEEAQVEALFADALGALGRLDALVNTVGIAGPRGPVESLSLADWRRTLAVNLDGMFLTVARAVPAMKAAGGGAIVNFSSGSTRTAMPLRSPYVASKAAVEGLTRALARELGPHGIRVNAVLPGMIDNERMRGIVARVAEQEGRRADEVETDYLKFISMRSKIAPEEIADMVLFLCSDGARHVSGQLIGVDGNIEWEP